MRIKYITLKALPYLLASLVGLLLFYLSQSISNVDARGMVINVAAALVAIPLIFIVYEFVQEIAHKKLNKVLFDYAKMKADKEIMAVMSQLMKLTYDYQNYELSPKSLQEFLSLDEQKIKALIEKKDYFGFQVFKSWEESEKYFEEALKHPFMLKVFEDEQIITLVEVMRKIGTLGYVSQKYDLFVESGQSAQGYKLVAGTELNPNNSIYPNRLLLLKTLSDGKHQVQDFGDFSPTNKDKLLKLYKIDSRFIDALATDIFELIEIFNQWFSLTGKEFIFHPRQVRVRARASQVPPLASQP